MINHVRTLLLNKNGNAVSPDDFAHEFVPPAFLAGPLSTFLRRVHQGLFGTAPDIAGLNFRLRQFAPLLHTAALEPFTLARDKRVTYWPDPVSLFNIAHTPQVVGNNNASVNFVITPGTELAGADNKLLFQWDIIFVDDTDAYLNNSANVMYVSRSLSISGLGNTAVVNSVGNPINVPGVPGLACQISGSVAQGEVWHCSYMKRPAVDPVLLPDALFTTMTEEADQHLFGTSDDGFFSVLRNYWLNSKYTDLRLGSLLLALAYKTEAERQGGS